MVIKVTMPDDCLTLEQWESFHQFLDDFIHKKEDEED